MRKLAILGLILAFACTGEDTQPITPCQTVSISDANPIQFWPVNCATWNQSRPSGVHHYCFCQPWQCDDEIKINFESSDNAIQEEIVSEFDTDFDGWFNTINNLTPGVGDGSLAPWAWSSDFGGSLKVTTVNTFGTTNLRLSGVSVPQQPFTLRVKFAFPAAPLPNSNNLRLRFIIRDSSNSQLLNQLLLNITGDGLEQTADLIITTESIWQNADHFLITSSSDDYDAGDELHINEISYSYEIPVPYELVARDLEGVDLFSLPFTNTGFNYSASFTPSSQEICDQQIILLIVDSSNTPVLELHQSDCLDIKQSHIESVLIEYTNHSNYAGIDYGSLTPDPSFNLRIPAIFFESRFPQEGEDFQTSSNEVISLNSQIKEQRLLSTDRMPKYMHRKILLALSHQFIFIEGEYWVKGGENYEKKEKSNKRDSFDMYTCWLTRQDYVVRNIL